MSVFVAVLRDEFREEPQSVEVVLGSSTSLGCRAPSGQPEPTISWLKDDEQLRTTSSSNRVVVSESGTLEIRELRREDAGSYVCVASNEAGGRRTSPAVVVVRGIYGWPFRR